MVTSYMCEVEINTLIFAVIAGQISNFLIKILISPNLFLIKLVNVKKRKINSSQK